MEKQRKAYENSLQEVRDRIIEVNMLVEKENLDLNQLHELRTMLERQAERLERMLHGKD
jgi:hypothetical protein